MTSRLRLVVPLYLLCHVCHAASAASAEGPYISLEGGESVMGTGFSSRDRTPTAFGEVVWKEHYIGSSPFTWAPDAIGGWIDGRNWIRDPVRRYPARDHIWLLGAGLRLQYGKSEDWFRPLFFSF